MVDKLSKKAVLATVGGIIGTAGALASVIALWPDFVSLSQGGEPEFTGSGSGNSQIVGNGNTHINDSTVIYQANDRAVQAKSNAIVPKSYLDNLPGIRCQAYAEARPLWDSGVTMKMSEGNFLVSSRLREVLIETAGVAYNDNHFEGNTAENYYSEKIDRLTAVSRNSMPKEGTLWGVLAGAQEIAITEDLIENVVQDISDPTYFLEWKTRWDRAKTLNSLNCVTDL